MIVGYVRAEHSLHFCPCVFQVVLELINSILKKILNMFGYGYHKEAIMSVVMDLRRDREISDSKKNHRCLQREILYFIKSINFKKDQSIMSLLPGADKFVL